MKRPPSVWLTQILCLLNGVPVFLGFGFALIRQVLQMSSKGISPPPNLPLFFLLLIGATLAIVAFWRMQKRKSDGRWLGVIFLFFGLSFMVFVRDGFSVNSPTGGGDSNDSFSMDHSNGSFRPMTHFIRVIFRLNIYLLYIILILRLAFGSPARQFFGALKGKVPSIRKRRLSFLT
jgi:hypothetical protein